MAWAPDYITANQLAAYDRIDDLVDNIEIGLAITAACRVIDFDCSRQFGKTDSAEQRTYVVQWDGLTGLWYADIDDLQDVTGLDVVADGASLTASEYRLLPLNAPQEGKPYEAIEVDESTIPDLSGQRRIDITVDSWGWTATPDPVTQAALFLASKVLARRSAPFGIAGGPDFGVERPLSESDPLIAQTLRPFWRLSKSRLFA